LEVGHSLAEKVCQFILCEFIDSTLLEYDIEKIHDILSQIGIHNFGKNTYEIVKRRIVLKFGELFAENFFVDGNVHEVQHGLETLLVLLSISTAKFNQRKIVALELLFAVQTDLLAVLLMRN
jgi:hypothetical protein